MNFFQEKVRRITSVEPAEVASEYVLGPLSIKNLQIKSFHVLPLKIQFVSKINNDAREKYVSHSIISKNVFHQDNFFPSESISLQDIWLTS